MDNAKFIEPILKSEPLVSAAIFYLNKKVLDNLFILSNHLKTLDTPKLRAILETLEEKTIHQYRLLILSISFELSDRGIAPRWQGIIESASNNEQFKVISPTRYSDAIIIDLYWLTREFNKHRTGNKKWNGLFINGFNLQLAASIASRRQNLCVKINAMNLSVYQEIGCIALYSNKSKKIRQAANRASVDNRIKVSKYSNNKSSEEITSHRRLIIKCAKLADCSPQKTASIYKWITGEVMSRQNASKLIKQYNLKTKEVNSKKHYKNIQSVLHDISEIHNEMEQIIKMDKCIL
jgi:hypothetical protein